MVGSHSPAGDILFPFNKGSQSRGVHPCWPRDTFLICLLRSILISACFCCCCSAMADSATPQTAAHQASLSFPISWSLLKLMPIGSMTPSNHLSLCRPLLNLLAVPKCRKQLALPPHILALRTLSLLTFVMPPHHFKPDQPRP